MADVPDYVSPKELLVGRTFPLCGRDLYIYDCDEFTRHFYQKWLGVDQTAIPETRPGTPNKTTNVTQKANVEEKQNSLQAVFQETLEKGDKSLKFEATLVTAHREDANRSPLCGHVLPVRFYDQGV